MEGFEAVICETHLMKLIVRHQLTHQVTKATKAVSDECVAALRVIYTDEQDESRKCLLIHDRTTKTKKVAGKLEIIVLEANLQLMARVTSRIFLGEELCRHKS